MAKSKDDITYGLAQARLSEDDAVRVCYKGGVPLEGGKIADSEPIELFSSAYNIQKQPRRGEESASETAADSQRRDAATAAPPSSDKNRADQHCQER
ncbi:unnamed protein product [Cuscuta epithymum]|uniref:Uncharacterized protein n=1 Tax=Cuscuta epithymum TaxID=186058 RepID=A0AAV0C485_9ASTE|nr:unnamed protein product [Cuscuta epithymum]